MIVFPPPLQELKKLSRPSLLKEAHERTLECFYFGTRNFRDSAVAIDEAARDLFELEVSSYISVDKDFGKLSRSDDELWNKIDGIIAITSKFFGRRHIWSEFPVELGISVRRNAGYLVVRKTCVKLRLALSPP
jgi:hypothetical protein